MIKVVKKDYDWDSVRHVFEKEAKNLVKKTNDYYKKKGVQIVVTLIPRLYFSDGYKMRLKFSVSGDNKGKEWWRWANEIDGMETKNLIVKNESNLEICLKQSWRPESHRGQIAGVPSLSYT